MLNKILLLKGKGQKCDNGIRFMHLQCSMYPLIPQFPLLHKYGCKGQNPKLERFFEYKVHCDLTGKKYKLVIANIIVTSLASTLVFKVIDSGNVKSWPGYLLNFGMTRNHRIHNNMFQHLSNIVYMHKLTPNVYIHA